MEGLGAFVQPFNDVADILDKAGAPEGSEDPPQILGRGVMVLAPEPGEERFPLGR
jgi:hypothetical protein